MFSTFPKYLFQFFQSCGAILNELLSKGFYGCIHHRRFRFGSLAHASSPRMKGTMRAQPHSAMSTNE